MRSSLPEFVAAREAAAPLYFLHIPKTAGTSFNHYLESLYEPAEVLPAHLWRQLIALNPQQIGQPRLIWGHFYAYLSRVLPGPLRYVTFLRDPIERALSHYGHIVRHPQHYFHERTRRMTFGQFIRDPELGTTSVNFQVRSLAHDLDPVATATGLTAAELDAGELERRLTTAPFDRPIGDMLECAMRRLENFAFVGISERYDQSVSAFARVFEVTPPHNGERLNVNPQRTLRSAIESADLEHLHDHNQADMALYSHACALLDRMVAGNDHAALPPVHAMR